ncbi:glycoside hydrolase family protein [bacterium]|nr:glycoside hydrolase family protein [bacterium]
MTKILKRIEDLMLSDAYTNSSNPKHKEVTDEVSKNFKEGANTKKKYKWVSEKGDHTCETCSSLDGKLVDNKEDFGVIFPVHPNCKCEIIEVWVEEDTQQQDEKEKAKKLTQKDLHKMAQEISDKYNNFISPQGVFFFMQNEGVKHSIYSDTKKVKTIGIGHRIKPDEKNKYKNLIISYDIIKNLLIEDLKSPIQSVKNISKLVDKNFTQNEKDALLSYILNRGSGNWINSEVYKSIKRKDFSNIRNNFLKDTENQDAETKKELTNRRNREYNLFEKGIYPIYEVKIE